MTQLVRFLIVPISSSKFFKTIIKPLILSKFCKSVQLRMNKTKNGQNDLTLLDIIDNG